MPELRKEFVITVRFADLWVHGEEPGRSKRIPESTMTEAMTGSPALAAARLQELISDGTGHLEVLEVMAFEARPRLGDLR